MWRGCKQYGVVPGLASIRRLLSRLGNPQERAEAYVHIAGTNGKGSVLAMLSAVLARAGYRTGTYSALRQLLEHRDSCSG